MKVNKNFVRYFVVILIVLLALPATFVLGMRYGKKAIQVKTSGGRADLSIFWDVWDKLDEHYADNASSSKPTDDMDKIYGAAEGLAGSYNDPYTVFLPPEESKSFSEEISGSFGGVGMEIGVEDNMLTVIAPIKGSPATRAGVKAGDKIVKIGDELIFKPNIEAAIRLIRGEIGTDVEVTFLRKGEKGEIVRKFTRARIDIPTLDTETVGKDIFVIRLYNFSATSHILFRSALRQFISSGADKLIIDLRNNPGGYLESAQDMASYFLPSSKVIVQEDFGTKKTPNSFRSRGYDVFNTDLQLVILVNKGSASASEILAGALRDHGRAVLIGEKTYGKGSVQNLIPITDDTSLKVTVARWLTPKGVSIDHDGLEPDILVEDKVVAASSSKGESDPVMDRAVTYLRGAK